MGIAPRPPVWHRAIWSGATVDQRRSGSGLTDRRDAGPPESSAGVQRADRWRTETDADSILLDDLPPCVRGHADLEWFHRFAQCFADIRSRLANDLSGPIAMRTGDEIAVHLTLDFAQTEARSGTFDADPRHCDLR